MRELKALELAARAKIAYDGKAWTVPSQSSPSASYRVLLTPMISCSCEDFQLTNKPCKHIIAARLVRERDGIADAPPSTPAAFEEADVSASLACVQRGSDAREGSFSRLACGLVRCDS